MTEKIVVLCACGSASEAERVARLLVEGRLAACVNILPNMRSIYRWQGRIEDSAETMLYIKTTAARLEAVSATIGAAHSYRVPEIIALPITAGSREYLEWIETETNE